MDKLYVLEYKHLQLLLLSNKIKEVHHGDCVGSVTDFHNECVSRKITTIIHPPNVNSMRSFCKGDEIKEPQPYLTRNKSIVNSSDMLIAFPKTEIETSRSGTWSTVRYAKTRKKKIIIVFPSGEIERIN